MTNGDHAAEFLRRIVELEQVLDAQLQDWREVDRLDLAFVETAGLWSKAVWATAEVLGLTGFSPATLDRGLTLAQRPVFICGVHRSGTTLLRDLLDGHPALVILPSESNYYTNFEKPLRGLATATQAEFLGRKWLERIVNPNNQPPNWLLGRSTPLRSPYVDFAREFRAWGSILESRRGPGSASWPLIAFALAYATRTGGGEILPGVEMWVEKSPTNEKFLNRLWAAFPKAKVVHAVRRPDAVLSSYKALLERDGRPTRQAAGTVRNLARSYRVALDRSRHASPDRYCLVRYEQLVAQPGEVIGKLTDFLAIEPQAILSSPTVGGVPASNNSAFIDGRSDQAHGLTRTERDLLAIAVGRDAALLGYLGIEPASWLGRSLERLLRADRPGRRLPPEPI